MKFKVNSKSIKKIYYTFSTFIMQDKTVIRTTLYSLTKPYAVHVVIVSQQMFHNFLSFATFVHTYSLILQRLALSIQNCFNLELRRTLMSYVLCYEFLSLQLYLFPCVLNRKHKDKQQEQSTQGLFSNICYLQYISDLLQLS